MFKNNRGIVALSMAEPIQWSYYHSSNNNKGIELRNQSSEGTTTVATTTRGFVLRNQSSEGTTTVATTTRGFVLRNQSSGGITTAATTTRGFVLRNQSSGGTSTAAATRNQSSEGTTTAATTTRASYLPVDPLAVELLDWFRNATNPLEIQQSAVSPVDVDAMNDAVVNYAIVDWFHYPGRWPHTASTYFILRSGKQESPTKHESTNFHQR